MNNEKKNKRPYIIRFIAVFALLLACVAAGAYTGTFISEDMKNIFGFVMLGLIGLIIVLMICNRAAANIYSKRASESIREMQENYARRRELAINDLPSAMKKTVKLRRIIQSYSVFILLVGLFCGFVIGMSEDISYGLTLFPLYLLIGVINRFDPVGERFDFKGYSDPKEYPNLHALAHKAAKTLGMDREIRIEFGIDCNAGIAKIGKVYSLRIGALLLDVITEEELFQIFLHEFAHMTKDGNPGDKENRLFGKIEAQSVDNKSAAILNMLFMFPDSVFAKEYILYRITASEAIEVMADMAVIKHGDPQTAMNGLAKLAYHDRFMNESNNYLREPFYKPETMREDMADVMANAFRKAVSERADFWKDLIMREIQPRNASHPIFRLRMQAVGVEDFTVTLPDYESDFRRECLKARAEVNKKAYEESCENYAEIREEKYLKPKRLIDNWEANGKKLTDESARGIMEALWALSRYDEVESVCDGIIQNNENAYATPHAHLLKGILLLQRYDRGGIDHIYKAIEINKNYIEEGLEIIGKFCCLNGLQNELETYREKAVELGQFQMDEYSKLSELKSTDNLQPEALPAGMLEGILDYIIGIGEDSVSRIYLVRKVISENFFGSCFVIRFKEGVNPETVNRVMDKIFNHLDTHPTDWQFSLFIYDPVTAQAVAKIKNCCVYDYADK